MLTLNGTTRSYSGKVGCMCGCLGKYNEGERARKMAITALLKDPTVKFQAWANDSEGCLYTVYNGRTRALYLNEQGVATARQLGYAEIE
jgi:hypothetical protein